MKNKHSNSVFRKYYFYGFLIIMSYMAIAFPIVYFNPGLLSIIISVLLYFPVKLLIRITANKIIVSILFDDLDAQGFQQILNDNKYFIPPLSYRINAALFSGDYQTVVNLSSAQLRKKKCPVNAQYDRFTIQ